MSSFYQLEFEKPLLELDRQIEEAEADLKRAGGVSPESSSPDALAIGSRVDALRARRAQTLIDVYSNLTAWEVVQVARHPKRPQTRDYIDLLCRDFCELHGDRRFGDDPAMVTGFARIGPHRVLIVGHQKGRTTQEKIACHFGCAHPEGYRKAMLKMKLAEKFRLPIITFVDTPGAYPGIGAEERGQAEAIAYNLREMSDLRTPILSVVIGEGGSGGALGIAVADRVAMMQYAWYSVISPEGCAAILWKQANKTTNTAAAESLKLTAADNLRLGIIDRVITEPVGAAHRDPAAAAKAIEQWILVSLPELERLNADELIARRYDRFRAMGAVTETASA
ncbi:MAG: acetyl-CoA carboxylase carboxyltransferase subunit alpha [Phycisphaerales bacterium]|jgi:acetyl-CoA carboxylase carboxyl transferase subunit alpha|nr:acetyl-CoA carboxylase carboxyltransferase subunit alpha [Phycisphaeraceae bacterium]